MDERSSAVLYQGCDSECVDDVDPSDVPAAARQFAYCEMTASMRKQMDGPPKRPVWHRAIVARVWAERAAAYDIFEKHAAPCMPEKGRVSRRKIVALSSVMPSCVSDEVFGFYGSVLALFDLCVVHRTQLPVLCFDHRAHGGVVIVRLPLEGSRR